MVLVGALLAESTLIFPRRMHWKCVRFIAGKDLRYVHALPTYNAVRRLLANEKENLSSTLFHPLFPKINSTAQLERSHSHALYLFSLTYQLINDEDSRRSRRMLSQNALFFETKEAKYLMHKRNAEAQKLIAGRRKV